MDSQKPIKYFLYRRKSTDDDRQVLSLDSQETEALKRFSNLKIIKLPAESVSAFEPYKRPVFADMVRRISKGEAQGIIAWHPDRLSRNIIEAAQIIHLLEKNKIQDLKFCSYHFDNSPEGKMMLEFTLSQSKYSSSKLSKDVKRGLEKKASIGWRPGIAPMGYLNSKTKLKGEQDISIDPERFPIVKQLFNTFLAGNYTVPKLLKYANELGLTLQETRNRMKRTLHLSKLYAALSNTFYYGWYEYPKGSGNWVKGKHEAMITEQDFDKIQFLLGRKGRPRPKTHKFAFTGMIRCSCGSMITAEEKFKTQKNGNTHHYIYYHCTKKKNPHCTQKAIELKELTKQIDSELAKITIPEEFKDWAIQYVHEIRQQSNEAQKVSIINSQKDFNRITEQLQHLALKYASPENSDGKFMTQEEYLILRTNLLKQKENSKDKINYSDEKSEQMVELTKRTFNFARYARIWFEKGNVEIQKAILASLGSELVLNDKNLSLNLNKPFELLSKGLLDGKDELSRLEPIKNFMNTIYSYFFKKEFPILSGQAESNCRLDLGKVA